jgi:EAL domain-containing protein (putative c-di-GMP-specific phosphodiesterase class I)
MMNDRDNRIITDTIVTIAQSFKLKVIAEGVEDVNQLAHLKSIGCDLYQGFLCSEPVSAQEFEALVMHSDKKHSL